MAITPEDVAFLKEEIRNMVILQPEILLSALSADQGQCVAGNSENKEDCSIVVKSIIEQFFYFNKVNHPCERWIVFI